MNLASIKASIAPAQKKATSIKNVFARSINKIDEKFMVVEDFIMWNVYNRNTMEEFKAVMEENGLEFSDKAYHPKDDMWLCLEYAREEVGNKVDEKWAYKKKVIDRSLNR